MGHVTAPELPRAKRRELEPRGACGGPGVALGLVAGAGAMRHMAAPELP
jgi:hypothetical protein